LLCSISVFFKKYVFLHSLWHMPTSEVHFLTSWFLFLFEEVHFHISMSYFEKFLMKKCCSTIDQDFIYTFLSPLKIKTKVKQGGKEWIKSTLENVSNKKYIQMFLMIHLKSKECTWLTHIKKKKNINDMTWYTSKWNVCNLYIAEINIWICTIL